jgi:hypothetical protein
LPAIVECILLDYINPSCIQVLVVRDKKNEKRKNEGKKIQEEIYPSLTGDEI